MNVSWKPLFSAAGLLAVAVALVVAVGLIGLLPGARIDLSEDRLYSLSDGTRGIVAGLDHPMELMFFYSDSATGDAPQVRAYARRVRELLREIALAGEGKLRLSVIDPEPFSEEEDLATRYGVSAVPVTQGGPGIYFGLVVAREEGGEGEADNPFNPRISRTMPLIRPDQEPFLEYEVLKLIDNVNDPDRPVVGLLTGLDIDGGFDPAMGRPLPPWMVMDLIRQLYEVRRVPAGGDSVDEEIDLLMVVHPQDLSERMLYAIDQHVMRGGGTIVFLDPNADSMVTRSPGGALIPAGMRSDMPRLLEAWGVVYDSGRALADSGLALRVMTGEGGRPVPHPGMVGARRDNLAGDDIITSRLETVNLSSAGVISPAEDAPLLFEPLIESSASAMLMDAALLESVIDPSVLFDEFEPTGERYVVAARLSGMLDSAFPDGRPPAEDGEEDAEAGMESGAGAPGDGDADAESDAAAGARGDEDEGMESDADAGAPDDGDADMQGDAAAAPDGEPAEEPPVHIARTAEPANIVVFADSDMLSDRLWVQVARFLGRRIPQPFADNGDVVINALDNLSGGADLVSIRSRGTYSRPFTRVLELQREADDRLRLEEAELLDRLAETEQALAELNRPDGEDDQAAPFGPPAEVAPEVQAEIDRFNAELIDTRRRLRDVRYQLTEDIERLGDALMAVNTAAVPALLTLFVLIAHFLRSRRRAG